MIKHLPVFVCLLLLCLVSVGRAETLFFEAENFAVEGNGWRVNTNAQARRASLATALNGASGDVDSTASQVFEIPKAGTWRIWVRWMTHRNFLGPFDVEVLAGERVVASQTFGQAAASGVEDWGYHWESLDVELTAGQHTLRLRKHGRKNASGYARNVDAVLITDDLEQQPDHVPFGPQTWMRVTLGEGYDRPVQIHVFADHYRSPWYAHYALSKDGTEKRLQPSRKEALLSSGETTGWCNISEMVYQDSGARLVIYPAHTYSEHAKRFDAVIEFANAPDDAAVVRRLEVNREPSTMHLVVPPNLESEENLARLRTDLEWANEIGALADNHDWPTVGRKPERFPFFVSASLDPSTLGREVVERELKTLSYFGFNGLGRDRFFEEHGYGHKSIGNVGWYTKGSYSAPDLERMRPRAASLYKLQREAGIEPQQIAFAMVMDEPTGEPASKLAQDEASIEGFRAWLKGKGLTPSDLLVGSWEEVKPVVEAQRDAFPALHYYTQQYRTVALGNFIALQKELLHEQWQTDFPVVVNFSDGAIYHANFYTQGVDYFTLLRETDQNAIWSEDWSNGSSTYHAATYNVELMRAAARRGGEWMGHHLIAYAGRKPYDIRLKAVSEVARGVKAFESFAYGPAWATHEGTPWQKFPAVWSDHASAVHEIGAVEEFLLPAQPRPAKVALLYASSSDIWTHAENFAYGFERMHTWLALAHAQVPVDVVHESGIEEGVLEGYEVAYLSGPNLTRSAAVKLRAWVEAGGTLVLSAGAGQFDEFNRPMDVLDGLLPYKRLPVQTLQAYRNSGRYLSRLESKGVVTTRGGATIDVLSVQQAFEGVAGGSGVGVEATFADGAPAVVRSSAGRGSVVSYGYLPALAYIRAALLVKGETAERQQALEEAHGIPGPEDVVPLELNEKSYNPWAYPADVREHLLEPVRAAKVDPPIRCSVPVVDAVYMTGGPGVVIPLANYTLQPIERLTLEIAVDGAVREARSVHQGELAFEAVGDGRIRLTLPLDCTDFVTLRY